MGNSLLLNDTELLSNMNTVQKRKTLSFTTDLERCNFCVEMETGVKLGLLKLNLFLEIAYTDTKTAVYAVIEKVLETFDIKKSAPIIIKIVEKYS